MALACLVCAATAATAAEQFIVTKEGKGVWASTAQLKGKELTYTEKGKRRKGTFNASELDAVIPVPQRGKTYSEASVKRYIARIRRAKNKHRKILYGPLNRLEQDWASRLISSDTHAAAMDGIIKAFEASDRMPDACGRAVLRLEMLRNKDVGGGLAGTIDEQIKQVKADCVATTTAYLKLQAGAKEIAIDDYHFIKQTGSRVVRFGDKAFKATVTRLVDTCRATTIASNGGKAIQTFMGGRSVDAYLDAMGLLYRLRDEVASTDLEQASVRRRIQAMMTNVGKFVRGYSFSRNGCPLTRADAQQLATVRQVLGGMDNDKEECVLFPSQRPPTLKLGRAFQLPLRAVFNRAQPGNATYRLTISLGGTPQGYYRHVTVKTMTLKNGRWDYLLKEDFARLPAGFSFGETETGEPITSARYTIRLSRHHPNAEPGEPEWIRLCGYMALPITP
jgi:hypothetical protein